MIGQHKRTPHRKPIADTDLLRLVDAVIFGDRLATLTEHELGEARKSEPYRMMQRVGIAMYRAGEQGLRPRPALMVVQDRPAPKAVPVTDEQPEPTEAPAQ